ncbi:MAG: TIGR04086 family membrane protein [Oscillospiraceae bacterium]|nr:TIGR04086 family membrane protein [Oscillospiraceae bacterium]
MPAKRRGIRVYILSTIVGVIAGGLTLPLFSLVIRLLQLPVVVGDNFALTAFGVACLAAGFTAGRLRSRGGFISGVKAALLLVLLVFVATFVLGGLSGDYFVGRLITALICGSVGGVLGVNKR